MHFALLREPVARRLECIVLRREHVAQHHERVTQLRQHRGCCRWGQPRDDVAHLRRPHDGVVRVLLG